MQRVEQRLDIAPEPELQYEVVKVQEPQRIHQLIERLATPQLCLEDRLEITNQLREVLDVL